MVCHQLFMLQARVQIQVRAIYFGSGLIFKFYRCVGCERLDSNIKSKSLNNGYLAQVDIVIKFRNSMILIFFFFNILALSSLYSIFTYLIKFSPKPYLLSVLSMYSWSTESKAFLASKDDFKILFMMLNKILIRWFWVDVTTKARIWNN